MRCWGWGSLFAVVLLGCGSRTVLREHTEEPASQQSCETSEDCVSDNLCERLRCIEGLCQVAFSRTCESEDPCQRGVCDPVTGECGLEPLTPDEDGDGFRAPLPGFLPGEPGSCGDDCDDTRASAHPGGVEICDGVDNDCDGIVDNGSTFLDEQTLPRMPEPLLIEQGRHELSGASGLAFGEDQFFLSYWAQGQETQGYIQGRTVEGELSFAERRFSSVPAPSLGAQVVWSGASFGVVWSDARLDENYEIYFARFDTTGQKLAADVRVSQAPGFSIHPQVLYDQGQYLIVWHDRREEVERAGGLPRIFVQVLDSRGELVGENQVLTRRGVAAEAPRIAASARRYGLSYLVSELGSVGLEFRSFHKDFSVGSAPLRLADQDVRSPSVVSLGDLFLVTWEIYGREPGSAIWGALVSETGELLIEARPLTSGARFARSHATVSLGDRVLLVWGDDLEGNFDLYAKVLAPELTELEPRRRLTDHPSESLTPVVALTDRGTIGILYSDWRLGRQRAHLLTLQCAHPGLVEVR